MLANSPDKISKSGVINIGIIKWSLCYYRPISVIPTVTKISEKIINDKLYYYLNENGLLNSGQPGFLSLHTTPTA